MVAEAIGDGGLAWFQRSCLETRRRPDPKLVCTLQRRKGNRRSRVSHRSHCRLQDGHCLLEDDPNRPRASHDRTTINHHCRLSWRTPTPTIQRANRESIDWSFAFVPSVSLERACISNIRPDILGWEIQLPLQKLERS